MGQLDNKVAIVTGGASGIGEATARLFVDEGAVVYIADVQDDRGQALADELGDRAIFTHANVANEEHVRALVGRASTVQGHLDVMFNNAGLGGVVGPIAQQPVEEFDTTVAVLFRGVFLGLKHAGRIMGRQRSGSIISTSSIAARVAGVSPHVYSACKAAVIQLSRSVAMELGEKGVRVNCVCPGAIHTPMVAELLTGDYGREDEVEESMSTYQPIRRTGLPVDVARVVLWLAGEQSSFVTGHALVVDGGMSGGVMWSELPGEWMRQYYPMREPGPLD